VAGRRVYFSFHYERDVWRASTIRNANVVDASARAGWNDASIWEEAKRKGAPSIQRLIDRGLKGTSVTAVLLGEQTANRRWVSYEVEKSIERGNGLLGVRIHALRDQYGQTCKRGKEPARFADGRYRVYDWSHSTFGRWVERAAIDAGKPCLQHGRVWCFWCKLFGSL